MKQPVLVRGSLANWPYVLLTLVAFLLLGLAAWAGFGKLPELAIVLGVVGVFLLLLVPILRWRAKRLRMWVEDKGDGFKVIDYVGERDFRDDQVLSSALLFKSNFSNGVYKSQTRTFRIWLTSLSTQPEMLELTNTMKIGEDDPLAAFLQRLNDRLFDQAKQDLAAGHAVLGERWSLDRNKLTLRMDKKEVEASLPDLTAIDVLEEHVCLWRQGQDEAYARLPAKTANAHLLCRLVGEHLEKRPKQADQPPPEGSLGRILFERKASEASPWATMVLAILCFVGGPVLMVIAREATGLLLGGGMIFVGALLILLFFHMRKKLFRCHEYGVHQRGLFMGERSLRYVDVGSFTYSATRHYHNGAYMGTQTIMTFEPVPEKKGQRISYSANVQNQDAALDDLRDQVARIMAIRMAQRVSNGEAVPWIHNLTFMPEGLDYRPSGFFGSKEPVFIPYGSIFNWNLEAGTFYLWQKGKKKPVIQEGVGQANFFPGYTLLEMLSKVSHEPAESEIVENEGA
jgi:hypothetical protein